MPPATTAPLREPNIAVHCSDVPNTFRYDLLVPVCEDRADTLWFPYMATSASAAAGDLRQKVEEFRALKGAEAPRASYTLTFELHAPPLQRAAPDGSRNTFPLLAKDRMRTFSVRWEDDWSARMRAELDAIWAAVSSR